MCTPNTHTHTVIEYKFHQLQDLDQSDHSSTREASELRHVPTIVVIFLAAVEKVVPFSGLPWLQ